MALVIAMAMVLGMMSMSAFAAHGDADDEHTLTITPQNTVTGHTYIAYQIFKGVLEADQAAIEDDGEGDTGHPVQLNSLAWGDNVDSAKLLTALKADDTIGADFADAADAADVAAVLATYANDDASMRVFAAIIGDPDNGILTETIAPKFGEAEAGQDVVIEGLVDGYYFIKDETGTQDITSGSYTRFILRVVGDTTVTAKDVLPDIDKVIEEGDDEVTANNGSIGDKVNYKVSGEVPNMDGYTSYKYEIEDTMTKGLTFNDDVAVKIGTTELARVYKGANGYFYPTQEAAASRTEEDPKGTNAVTAGYTVVESTDQTTGVTTINLYIVNFIQYNTEDYIGKDIEVTYSATINENALDTAAEGNLGNINSAKLIYSNNPNQSDKGDNDEPDDDNPSGEGPEKDVRTYTTGVEILKYDDQNSDKKLAGAVFELTGDAKNVVIVNEEIFVEDAEGTYYKLKDGTYTTDVSTDDTADDYVSTTTKYKKETVVTKTYNEDADPAITSEAYGATNEDGQLTFVGLGEGLYTITETQAPTGYNLLKNPIYIYVEFTQDEDGEGNPTNTGTFTVYKYNKDSSTAPTFDAESEDWTVLSSGANVSKILYDIDVPNNAGSELPSTGGVGTTIFYVVGALLVIGAGVILITRRRMDA